MDGNIYQDDTKGAYHVCSECRKGIVGPCWKWTEAHRDYFCSSDHAQDYQRRGGPPPRVVVGFIDDTEEVEVIEEEEGKPGVFHRIWKRIKKDRGAETEE